MRNALTLSEAIIQRMEAGPHEVWTTKDFTDLATYPVAKVALSRLVTANKIGRVYPGLFNRVVEVSDIFVDEVGKAATATDILDALARRDGSRWIYAPATASKYAGFTPAANDDNRILTDSRVGEFKDYLERKAGKESTEGYRVEIGGIPFTFLPAKPEDLYWAGKGQAAILVQALKAEQRTFSTNHDRLAFLTGKMLDAPQNGDQLRKDLIYGWAAIPREIQVFLSPLVYGNVRVKPSRDAEDQYDDPSEDEVSIPRGP